jgi:hypothetical protein
MTNTLGLPKIKVDRLSADAPFISNGNPIGVTVGDFWSWSSSDLLNNTIRGVLAEFLVAHALGTTVNVCSLWKSFDIKTAGGTQIEVKSASRWQSWYQKRPSKLIFGIQPTLRWDEHTNTYETAAHRQADIYVFCILDCPRKEEVNPLDLDQWRSCKGGSRGCGCCA